MESIQTVQWYDMELHEIPKRLGISPRHRFLHRSNSLQPEAVLERSSGYQAKQKSRNPGRSLTEIYTARTKTRANSSDPSSSLRRRTLTAVAPVLQSSDSREKRNKFLNRSYSEMSWSSFHDDNNSVSSYDPKEDDMDDFYSVKDGMSIAPTQANESILSSSNTEEEYELEAEKANTETSFLWIILSKFLKILFWIITLVLFVIIFVLVFSLYISYVRSQCDIRRTAKLPLIELETQLSKSVIGQEIAINRIINGLKDLENNKVKSPLLMWMVGWTGSGKTHSTNILKNVLSSTSQISIVIPSLYPQNDISLLKHKVKELYDDLHPCSFNVVVIDGWDENNQPFYILEQLLAHFRIGANHQREIGKTLIVLSGTRGSQSINREYIRLHGKGRRRENLIVDDFEGALEQDTPGRKMLQIVQSFVFVPFLPMETEQVRNCIAEELSKISNSGPVPEDFNYEKIADLVIGQLDFIPTSYPLLAVTGCKRVQALLRLLISKEDGGVR